MEKGGAGGGGKQKAVETGARPGGARGHAASSSPWLFRGVVVAVDVAFFVDSCRFRFFVVFGVWRPFPGPGGLKNGYGIKLPLGTANAFFADVSLSSSSPSREAEEKDEEEHETEGE